MYCELDPLCSLLDPKCDCMKCIADLAFIPEISSSVIARGWSIVLMVICPLFDLDPAAAGFAELSAQIHDVAIASQHDVDLLAFSLASPRWNLWLLPSDTPGRTIKNIDLSTADMTRLFS